VIDVRIAFFLSIVIVAGTGGEMLVAHAMKQIASSQPLTRPASVLAHLIGQAVRSGAVWLGLALQAQAFFALLALLSWADVSFIVPATALNYVVGAAGSALFLRERVNRVRWAGVLLVCLGVGVMFASEH
jgi:drug/metabolite transporter (DMT)-like permease